MGDQMTEAYEQDRKPRLYWRLPPGRNILPEALRKALAPHMAKGVLRLTTCESDRSLLRDLFWGGNAVPGAKELHDLLLAIGSIELYVE